jgi:hypothetical protein
VADQGLTLWTGFRRLDWTLRFTGPTVVIDGHVYERPWGQHFFPLGTGPHQIEIFYNYLGRRAGRASASIDVGPNQVVRASYRAPNSVVVAFLPGKLTVEPPSGDARM